MTERLAENTAFWNALGSVAEVAGLLWERGWAERNAGNLSIDVTDVVQSGAASDGAAGATVLPRAYPDLGARRLLVTAAGSRMRDVARDPDRHSGVLEFSADGSSYVVAWHGAGGGTLAPTSELPSHLAIHATLLRRRSPHRALVHTHPTELLALSHDRRLRDERTLTRLLWGMHPEVAVVVPDGVGLVPYVLPGTPEQGVAAAQAMERHDAALWEKHGAVAAGRGLIEAFDVIDTLNTAARLLLMCRAAGYEPDGLTDGQLRELRQALP